MSGPSRSMLAHTSRSVWASPFQVVSQRLTDFGKRSVRNHSAINPMKSTSAGVLSESTPYLLMSAFLFVLPKVRGQKNTQAQNNNKENHRKKKQENTRKI